MKISNANWHKYLFEKSVFIKNKLFFLLNLYAGKNKKEKKEKEKNLNISLWRLGEDFIVPMTPIHLGDIHHLIFGVKSI